MVMPMLFSFVWPAACGLLGVMLVLALRLAPRSRSILITLAIAVGYCVGHITTLGVPEELIPVDAQGLIFRCAVIAALAAVLTAAMPGRIPHRLGLLLMTVITAITPIVVLKSRFEFTWTDSAQRLQWGGGLAIAAVLLLATLVRIVQRESPRTAALALTMLAGLTAPMALTSSSASDFQLALALLGALLLPVLLVLAHGERVALPVAVAAFVAVVLAGQWANVAFYASPVPAAMIIFIAGPLLFWVGEFLPGQRRSILRTLLVIGIPAVPMLVGLTINAVEYIRAASADPYGY